MDSMDVNKAVAAVLVAGIAFFVTGLIGDNLIHETPLEKSVIAIEGAKPTSGEGTEKPGLPPIAPLLASANVTKGQQFVSQVCAVCHSLGKGGKPIVGPNLYGIVGAPHDHEAGFDYSSALEKYKGQPWTYEALNKWLDDPQTYAPGTRMTYTGIQNNQTRADVIDYLRTLSDHPEPLPKVEATATTAASGGGAAPQPSPAAELDSRLAKADVSKGKEFASQVCAVCHSLNDGGGTIVGPNLYGVVGGPHDHEKGFDYSAALEKFKGQPWTFAALNEWLTNPAKYAPGTRMTYAGIPQPQLRADVIAYLDTLSKKPVPIPKAPAHQAASQEPTKAAETAPAPGTTAPAGNHSAMSSAASPNSAPTSSPKTVGAPGSSYNAAQQTPSAGTNAGGTGAAPANKPNPSGATEGAASPAPSGTKPDPSGAAEGAESPAKPAAAAPDTSKPGPASAGAESGAAKSDNATNASGRAADGKAPTSEGATKQ